MGAAYSRVQAYFCFASRFVRYKCLCLSQLGLIKSDESYISFIDANGATTLMKKFSQISCAVAASVLFAAASFTARASNLSDVTGPNVSDITGPNVSDVTGPNVSDVNGSSVPGAIGADAGVHVYTVAESEQLAEAIQRAYEACESEREASGRETREGSNSKNRPDTDHQSRLYFDRENRPDFDRESRQIAEGQHCSELLRLLDNASDILGRSVASTVKQSE